MVDLVKLKDANVTRWAAAKLTRGPEFLPVAKRLVASKQRYLTVSKETGIPWPFIAATHQRESSQSWAASLAQGVAESGALLPAPCRPCATAAGVLAVLGGDVLNLAGRDLGYHDGVADGAVWTSSRQDDLDYPIRCPLGDDVTTVN